jgi:predicted amidohydrolase
VAAVQMTPKLRDVDANIKKARSMVRDAIGKGANLVVLPGAAPSTAASPRKITMVLNWTEELKQRVPVK